MFISVVAAAIIIFSGICHAQNSSAYGFVKHAADAPRVSYHDYIIVGGGTAGCPLAATLSKRFDVLVLERGGSPYGNPNVSNLASLAENLAYLTPTSPAQRFVSEDGVINTRARCLGGGTCINAGFYSRASRLEVMDMGLNPKLADQSFRWVERELVFRPQLTEWTSAFRAGLLEAGVTPDNGFTYEHLEGTKVGGTIFDPTGHRHTAADLLKYADPARITVLLRATAQRILFKNVNGQHKNPQAYGVVYKDETGNIHEARLKGFSAGEIILAAGALGSPQLLMLSGVGPADHLKSFGIEVVLDQPMVGHGIADNPLNVFAVPSPEPLTITSAQVVGIRPGYYMESSTGYLIAAILGGNSPQGAIIFEKLARPLSRGYLRLKNLDPEDNPSVTYNYFAEPEDLRACVEALQTVMRVIDTQALSKFRYPNQTAEYLQALTASLLVNNRTRSAQAATSLEQYCRDLVLTISHFHGGCEVGKVVDHEYRVIGVDGLRVIDGSTFSFSPGTNPQATVMMLGRYMGVLIGNGGVKPSD
ncbi:protein HOTHEAD-like [Curcuma longa]|uniref:protein HOTHEAD-like n=1 Tax=Curcuma longa TaxID=136217 RepID=UPI003D9E6DBF